MKKLLLLLTFGVVLQNTSAQSLDFKYQLGFDVGINGVMVPSRLNSFVGSGQSFEEYPAITGGMLINLDIRPIITDYFYYGFQTEYSWGLGYQGSHYYQVWGHELGLGINGKFYLTYHLKDRFFNALGYNPIATSRDNVDEFLYYSKYSGIKRNAYGLNIRLNEINWLQLAYIMEDFSPDINREPWQGALIRWEQKNSWGIETEVMWNHAAYGSVFVNNAALQEAGELSQTGIFVNFKVIYSIDRLGTYKNLIKKWK